jgi:hypothetical protein
MAPRRGQWGLDGALSDEIPYNLAYEAGFKKFQTGHCEQSEAISPSLGDCFGASPLAMTF